MKHFLPLGNALLILAVLAVVPAWAGSSASGDVSLARLAARLGSAEPGRRVGAADALRRRGQAALPGLLRLLRDGDPAERRGSAVGLALLPMPGFAVEGLVAALDDADPAVRSLAAHALAVIGAPAARATAARLASPHERARNGAAYALMLMRGRSVPALAAVLATDDPSLRARSAWLLGRMGRAALPAVPALVRALDCPDVRVMHVVAEAIDLIGPDPAVLAFHLMQLDAPGGRPLARLGRRSAPVLVRLLARPGTLTGQVAFRALAALGRPAVPALEETLRRGGPGRRIAAALLLVKMDPDYALRLPDDVRAVLVGAGRN